MKIVCENCSAKYSIADEKVRGKVFKIRCKKCGESIVVRGDASQEQEPAVAESPLSDAPAPAGVGKEGEVETRVFDYSGYQGGSADDTVWHIVVDGQQQGPYTSAQIKEYVAAGSLDLESFIWKEGFNDWIPIKEIPELIAGAAAQSPDVASAGIAVPQEPAPTGGGVFDQPASGGGLFDQPETGGGLFGSGAETPEASPFGDSGGGTFRQPYCRAGHRG